MDYEDGKLAHLETCESEIPVNIYAEPDSNFDLISMIPIGILQLNWMSQITV